MQFHIFLSFVGLIGMAHANAAATSPRGVKIVLNSVNLAVKGLVEAIQHCENNESEFEWIWAASNNTRHIANANHDTLRDIQRLDVIGVADLIEGVQAIQYTLYSLEGAVWRRKVDLKFKNRNEAMTNILEETRLIIQNVFAAIQTKIARDDNAYEAFRSIAAAVKSPLDHTIKELLPK
jgi:hypothetical protein